MNNQKQFLFDLNNQNQKQEIKEFKNEYNKWLILRKNKKTWNNFKYFLKEKGIIKIIRKKKITGESKKKHVLIDYLILKPTEYYIYMEKFKLLGYVK